MQNVRWWDAAAVTVSIVIVAISLVDPPYGQDDVGTWVLAGVFLLVHLLWGRRCVPEVPAGQHLAIAIAYGIILAAGTSLDPSFSVLQAYLYPFVWSTSPSLRSALIANVVVAIPIVIGYTVAYGVSGLATGAAVGALSLGFSIALGLWITRIAQYGDERARLLAELQAAQGQLAAMHRDAGIAEERSRLAREIHDTIAQSLTGLVMVAQRTGRRLASVEGEPAASARGDVELMEQMAREALTEARGLVASLAPVDPSAGLADALQRLAASFERETGVRVSVHADVSGLDRELEVVLLRCAQEGLANVRKHAGASAATITVSSGGPEVVLEVRDDGAGPGASAGPGGFGLAGMRDRVALVGGRMEFGPGKPAGAVLRVIVPVSRADGATRAETETEARGA